MDTFKDDIWEIFLATEEYLEDRGIDWTDTDGMAMDNNTARVCEAMGRVHEYLIKEAKERMS